MALLHGSDLIVKKRDNRTTTRTLPEGIVALLHGSDVIIVKQSCRSVLGEMKNREDPHIR